MLKDVNHNARRAAILRTQPELKNLAGVSPAVTLLGLAAVALQLVLAAAMAHRPWWAILAIAFCFGAFIVHCLNCIIHECTHNLVFRSTAANKALAIFVNLPSLVPSATGFRHYHLLHHHFFGVRGMDSDVPAAWEARLVGRSSLRKLLWLLLMPFTYAFIHPLQVRSRLPIDAWFALNVVTALTMWLLVLWFAGWSSIFYLLLSTYFSVGPHPAGAHILQEHVAFDGGNGMSSYYGPINLISVNLGYHLEHHDMPGVPGWQLPRLRQSAPDFYAGHFQHRSRSLGLWQFVLDRNIGLDSRPIVEIPSRHANA
jgi:sphingolipid delta-4 desaturase